MAEKRSFRTGWDRWAAAAHQVDSVRKRQRECHPEPPCFPLLQYYFYGMHVEEDLSQAGVLGLLGVHPTWTQHSSPGGSCPPPGSPPHQLPGLISGFTAGFRLPLPPPRTWGTCPRSIPSRLLSTKSRIFLLALTLNTSQNPVPGRRKTSLPGFYPLRNPNPHLWSCNQY